MFAIKRVLQHRLVKHQASLIYSKVGSGLPSMLGRDRAYLSGHQISMKQNQIYIKIIPNLNNQNQINYREPNFI
jgi:hypothetical protein